MPAFLGDSVDERRDTIEEPGEQAEEGRDRPQAVGRATGGLPYLHRNPAVPNSQVASFFKKLKLCK